MLHRSVGSSRGFTLIELLIVVVMTSVLARIAYPSFAELRRSFVRNSMKQQLESDVHRVRTEAMRQGVRALLSTSGDGSSYSIGFDYAPYSSPVAIDAGSVIVTRRVANGFSLTVSQPLMFDSRGYGVDADGAPDVATYSLSDGTETFLSATVYPTGLIEYGN